MQLKKEDLICKPEFEQEELMRIMVCLNGALNTNDTDTEEEEELKFKLFHGALLYLYSKVGATLDANDKKIVDSFSKCVLKKQKL